ncbi:DNA replication protein [Malassezia brasiliensis]|uniref:DNA replication complex GINS protein PSF3 n=1 Tax=Malassezia brasiliensis TaxID=1821822 RepID=A0AAF0DQX9_9BASI|nr:DNA replication protein [Malassezia brasiliensis]
MDADYWSVEAILAESQRLPCTFGVDVPGLGYLEESGEVDMHKHTRVELVEIVTIQMPRAFGSRVRAALDASPTSVQLHNLLPHWYALAVRLARLLESDALYAMLSKTYVGRIARIYELAVLLSRTPADASARSTDAALTHDMQAFMQGLDDSEQVLLTAGRAATRTMQEFLAGSD